MPSNFWPRDPYFDWFGYWLKDEKTELIAEPAVFYSPRAWVDDRASYRPDDWHHAERWPPPGVTPRRLYLRGDGSLGDEGRAGAPRSYRLRPAPPDPDLRRAQHADRSRPAAISARRRRCRITA